MTREEIERLLRSKGVELNIGGCGCCGIPWVSIKIDGELVVKDVDEFKMEMISA